MFLSPQLYLSGRFFSFWSNSYISFESVALIFSSTILKIVHFETALLLLLTTCVCWNQTRLHFIFTHFPLLRFTIFALWYICTILHYLCYPRCGRSMAQKICRPKNIQLSTCEHHHLGGTKLPWPVNIPLSKTSHEVKAIRLVDFPASERLILLQSSDGRRMEKNGSIALVFKKVILSKIF